MSLFRRLNHYNVRVALAVTGIISASVLILRIQFQRRRKRRAGHGPLLGPVASWLQDDEPDIPEEFRDAINYTVMTDPVVLCATGQVYDYKTLQEWFRSSPNNRVCPKTNIEVRDVQVVRLPWLKQKIREWMAQNNLPVPPEPDDVELEMFRGINAQLPTWIKDLRTDTGHQRQAAAISLNDLLCAWETRVGSTPEAFTRQAKLRSAVMHEMVWLVRYGSPYLQGIAASVLAYSYLPEEIGWLAASATLPMVLLLGSPNQYAQLAASKALGHIAMAGSTARRMIRDLGGVQSLLKIVSTSRVDFHYTRASAASALALLAEDGESRSHLRKYGVPHLKALIEEKSDRWEMRDAATVLLKLRLTDEELGTGFSKADLQQFQRCSVAWLKGEEEDPADGHTQEELRVWQEYEEALADDDEDEDDDEGEDEEGPGELDRDWADLGDAEEVELEVEPGGEAG